MPGREEINKALFGAYLLARRDPRGMGYFEISVEGFWRSFFAAALAAPMFAIIVALHHSEATAEDGIGWLFLGQAIRYVLDWAAYPLIVAVIARMVNLGHLYIGYIIAYNWAKVLINALFLVLAVLAATDIVPGALINFLKFAALVAVIYYLWFITCTALRLAWYVGAGLVAIEFIASLLIDGAVRSVLT
jgi:hypothetical protein